MEKNDKKYQILFLINFFESSSGRRDCYISLSTLLQELRIHNSPLFKGVSLKDLIKLIKEVSEVEKLNLNPIQLQNQDGRIIKKAPYYYFDLASKSYKKHDALKTQEMMYLQSNNTMLTDNVYQFTTLSHDYVEPE